MVKEKNKKNKKGRIKYKAQLHKKLTALFPTT